MDNVGLKTGQKGFPDSFGDLPAPGVGVVAGAYRAGGGPDADVFLGQDSVKKGAQGFNGVGEKIIEDDENLVTAPVAGNGQG